ncbi:MULTISPECIES: glycosyltransferase family 87 protein [unclassified Streptomyces]|uniref:glycosyltransferase family 87 protein n=1 Tax=Streptomyces sp. T21Q-yed TaxID=3018441 RepID=UPI0023652F03|nr:MULTISPECIES: glycosyltransferase family 87 protein [unclassified Streptomyces]MDF3140754.1 glycosyltransferase family 87 protein [Streptomyces sp. T21Q-yed]WDF44772.1 glycosyltransferase family 87 protein [Streptomyces sp. T12]
MRRATWHLWVVLGAVLGALVMRTARVTSDGGMDNAIVVRAARVWLAGGSPYDDPHFLYLPSAVLAAAPQAVIERSVLAVAVPVVVTGCLVGGWGCALRLHGVGLRSRFAVLGLIGLAVGFAPFAHLVLLGNWTATAALALPLGLLLAGRGRWVAAGVVIGAAVALKPLLAPVGLLFVFAGRWRGLVVMVGVPVVASVGAALLLPDPVGFFTRTLPFLLRGDDGFVRLYEASLVAVLPRVGVPGAVAGGIAMAAAGLGVGCAYRRWRRGCEGSGPSGPSGSLCLAETAAMLMLSAFLVSRPSYDHYLLVVVPVLLAGLPCEGAVARGVWFWLALVPQLPGVTWPYLEMVQRRAFRDAVTLCGLAVTVGVRCFGSGRASSPPPPLPVPSSRGAAPSTPTGAQPLDPAGGSASRPPGVRGAGE